MSAGEDQLEELSRELEKYRKEIERLFEDRSEYLRVLSLIHI